MTSIYNLPKKEEAPEVQEVTRRKVERAMKRQRKRALSDDPFFGVLGMKLQIVVCRKYGGRPVKTCATNGKAIFVNPEHFMDIPEEERYTVYLHEVLHVALMHHLRRGDRDPWWWNVAGDHAVNLLLKEKSLHLSDWLCDEKYKGWSAERIFRDVFSEDKRTIEPPPPDGPGGDGPGGKPVKPEDGPDGGSNGGTPEKPDDVEEGNNPKAGEDEDGGAVPDGGGKDPEGKTHGEVWDAENDDGSSLSDEEINKATKEVAESLNEARDIARQAGKDGSAGFKKTIKEVIVPPPDWKSMFAEFWNAEGDPSRVTWSRFNRRMATFGVWMPGVDKDGVENIVIFDDRSGSVGLAESRAFYAHTQTLRDEVSIERITLVPFNHVILQEEIVEIGPSDPLPTQIRSGGGTNFDACFNWLARQSEVPDKVIVLTDLGATVTVEEPDCPVLWASVCPVWESGRGYSNRPPFGDVIEIEVV